MEHALNVSESFQKVDSGPRKSSKSNHETEKTKSSYTGSDLSSSRAGVKSKALSKRLKKGKNMPTEPCHLPKCKGNISLH